MKATHQSNFTLAFLLLLASNIAPASAADRSGDDSGPPPNIIACTSDAVGPMRAGEVVHFILHGTSGLQAFIDIPKIGDHIALIETSPGYYSGACVVPPTISINGATIVGSLGDQNGQEGATMKAKESLTIDNTGPIISDPSPANSSISTTVRPEVYALINDGNGAGIDIPSVRLKVDGVDATRFATLTSHFVSYMPSKNLAPGPHDISVSASDLAGNRSVKNWSFDIPDHQNIVTSFKSDKPHGIIVLRPGQSVKFTLTGERGGTAFVTYGNLQIALPEVNPGQYVGVLTAPPDHISQIGAVTAHFTGSDNSDLTVDLSQQVKMEAGRPVAPQILAPQSGAHIGSELKVSGIASPGSSVDISISYSCKAYGLLGLTGIAAQAKALTDQRGAWSTDELQLSSPAVIENASKTTITVTATTVDALGQKSKAANIVVSE